MARYKSKASNIYFYYQIVVYLECQIRSVCVIKRTCSGEVYTLIHIRSSYWSTRRQGSTTTSYRKSHPRRERGFSGSSSSLSSLYRSRNEASRKISNVINVTRFEKHFKDRSIFLSTNRANESSSFFFTFPSLSLLTLSILFKTIINKSKRATLQRQWR